VCNETRTVYLVADGCVLSGDALRADLEKIGHSFSSPVDYEIIVHGYEQWGTSFLDRLSGTFAFALWDKPKGLLWIAKDHFGTKPLYYYPSTSFFAFASEIKELLAYPEIPVKPNSNVIAQYLRWGLLDTTEETFFEGIAQLRPAQHLIISQDEMIHSERYWVPPISRALCGGGETEEVSKIRVLFLRAIEQLDKDRPVVSLGGGIDSSSITCGLRAIHPGYHKIKAFSAVFPGESVDEADCVGLVCESAHAEHIPITPTAAELWRDLPVLVRCQEEPFGSPSVYAQWRVLKLAKEKGAGSMYNGEGADELLCGDRSYYVFYLLTLLRHGQRARFMKELVWSAYLLASPLKASLRDLISYGISALPSFSPDTMSSPRPSLSSIWKTMLRQKDTSGFEFRDLAGELESDVCTRSLPVSLRCLAKNSMWHGIDICLPFLYRPFFEFVASLPLDRKLRDGWTKRAFRIAMRGIVPERILLQRKKKYFEVPQKKWIENSLRDELKDLFLRSDLKATKYYSPKRIMRLLDRRVLTGYQIGMVWRVLNLELWYREFFVH
jgi:asparagine synthase (glutamine-hydrolysing)